MAKTVDVEIYGQRYTLLGDADDQYVRRLAKYVDEQMKAVANGLKTATPSKLAVLAAVNIAHELFQAEQLRVENEADVERRMMSLMQSIEEQMPSTLPR
ncbi:cell division protein ZapA [Nitrospira sp.]|nr:cell division protein ZapA [Nitrospira sp.]